MQYLMERPTPTLCRFRVTIDEERRGAARSAVMDMTPESDLEKNDIRAATMEWLVVKQSPFSPIVFLINSS